MLAQEDELGGPGEEMRFPLPAAPSPAAQGALLAACREVARAGGHAIAEPALALLAWELGDAFLAAFRWAFPKSPLSANIVITIIITRLSKPQLA